MIFFLILLFDYIIIFFRRLDCSKLVKKKKKIKKLFDYLGLITNVNYFSFFGFLASRLSSSLVVVLPGVLRYSWRLK